MVCSYWFLALFPYCIYQFSTLLFVEFSEKSSGENFLSFPSSHWTMFITLWDDVSSEEIIHRWCCWIPWVVINKFTTCSLGKLSNLRLLVISCFSWSIQLFLYCLFYEFLCEYVDFHFNLCKLFQLWTHI